MNRKRPHKDILEKDLRISEIAEFAQAYCPIIEDFIADASWILRESFERVNHSEDLALPLLCHIQLEMLDAYSEMIRKSISNPTQGIVRTIFEAHFYCRFICLEKEKVKLRSKCYIYEFYRQQDEFLEILMKGKSQKIKRTYFEDIISEHEMISKKERNVRWHRLFGGPKTLNKLIKVVREKSTFPDNASDEIGLYFRLCLSSHANDICLRINQAKKLTQIISFRCYHSFKQLLGDTGFVTRAVAFSLILLIQENNLENHQKTRAKDLWLPLREKLRKVEKQLELLYDPN